MSWVTSPPPELHLVPLEVRLVLHHLDETLQREKEDTPEQFNKQGSG